MNLDFFNEIVQVNLKGTINVIRLAVEKMISNTPNEEGRELYLWGATVEKELYRGFISLQAYCYWGGMRITPSARRLNK
jgi:hypothetical protein